MADRIEDWLKKATDADPPPSPGSMHSICSDSDTYQSSESSIPDTSHLYSADPKKPILDIYKDTSSVSSNQAEYTSNSSLSQSTLGPDLSEFSKDSTSGLSDSISTNISCALDVSSSIKSTSKSSSLGSTVSPIAKLALLLNPISKPKIEANLDSSSENSETPMTSFEALAKQGAVNNLTIIRSSATAIVDNSIRIKIICLGDSAVGKSKLVERFLLQGYKQQALSTVGVTTFQHKTVVNEESVVVDIWDTAGQEKFNNLHASYYHEAHACIAVFDCTRKITYKNLIKWIRELKTFRPQIPLVIAANKIDANIAATKTNFKIPTMLDCPLYFVSASDGTNVVKLFRDTIKLAYDYKKCPTDFIDEIMMELETMTIEDPPISEPCDKTTHKNLEESPSAEVYEPVESTESFDKTCDTSDQSSIKSHEFSDLLSSDEDSVLPPVKGRSVLLPPICVLDKPGLTNIGKTGLLPPVSELCGVSKPDQGESTSSEFSE